MGAQHQQEATASHDRPCAAHQSGKSIVLHPQCSLACNTSKSFYTFTGGKKLLHRMTGHSQLNQASHCPAPSIQLGMSQIQRFSHVYRWQEAAAPCARPCRGDKHNCYGGFTSAFLDVFQIAAHTQALAWKTWVPKACLLLTAHMPCRTAAKVSVTALYSFSAYFLHSGYHMEDK